MSASVVSTTPFASATAVNQITISITLLSGSGTGRYLALAFGRNSVGGDISGVTFDGVAMHALASVANGTNNKLFLYYLKDSELPAAAGAYTLEIAYTTLTSGAGVVRECTGVDQVTTWRDQAGASFLSTTGSGGVTGTLTFATQAGDLVLDSINATRDGSVLTMGAGQTLDANQPSNAGTDTTTNTSNRLGASHEVATGASTEVSWNSDRLWTYLAAAIVPDAASGGGDPLAAGTITAAADSATQVTLTETVAPSGGTAPFTRSVQRSPSGAESWTEVATSLPFSDTGLGIVTAYDYKVVYGDSAAGSAESGPVTVVTMERYTYTVTGTAGEPAAVTVDR